MQATCNLQGDRELIRRFGQLDKKLQRKGYRTATTKATRRVVKGLKAAAPTDTKTLKKSFGYRVKVYKRTHTVLGVVGPRKGFQRTIDGKTKDPVKYVHLTEAHNAWYIPAFDAVKDSALGILRQSLATTIISEAKKKAV